MAKKKEATQSKAMVSQYGFTDDKPTFLQEQVTIRGNENIGVDDITIPRLGLVQDLSPERKASKPEYIDGADTGMLFNTASRELYGESVNFVPVYFRKEWCIWKAQDAGGGFMGAFDSEDSAREEWDEQGYEGQTFMKGNVELPTYEIVDTHQQFGLILHEDKAPEEVVISCSKSKMKPSRNLNTVIKMRGGDRFSTVFRIGAVEDTNKNDQDFQNLTFSPLGWVSEEVYRAAEKMYDSIATGIKDAARDGQ